MRQIQLNKDEESFMARYDKVRGFNYDLTDTLYCVTAEQLQMPVKRKIFPGANRSNVLGPIACPPFAAVDSHNLVQWKEKKDVYSAACKIACRVGGAGPDGSPAELQRKPNTWEPVNFHSYTAEIWQELFHSHSVVGGVIDFTTGPGYVAEAAMVEKIP